VQGADAVRTIYSHSDKWKKLDDAKHVSHGILHLESFSTLECRRILESSFSFKAITAQQGVLLNCADTALTVTEIACENGSGEVDILQIARTYAFDVISMDMGCAG
jgi:hypothetical protein